MRGSVPKQTRESSEFSNHAKPALRLRAFSSPGWCQSASPIRRCRVVSRTFELGHRRLTAAFLRISWRNWLPTPPTLFTQQVCAALLGSEHGFGMVSFRIAGWHERTRAFLSDTSRPEYRGETQHAFLLPASIYNIACGANVRRGCCIPSAARSNQGAHLAERRANRGVRSVPSARHDERRRC